MSHVEFDPEWFRRHLLFDILPNWLRSSVTSEGLFLPRLDRRWNRLSGDFGTLVSQSRLLYNFSVGYEFTGDEAYLEAVSSGVDFLLSNFRDERLKGWYWSCRLDGRVLDSHKDCYGHAFVIFGLSHAYRILGNERLIEEALETWRLMKDRFMDEHGGFWRRLSRDYKRIEYVKSQNPMMHTFEALLALSEIEGLEHIRDEAAEVADFVTEKLRRKDGVLPEVFTADWRELPADRGGRIDLGHAFEWAYLLSKASDTGLSTKYLEYAYEFLGYGFRMGYDRVDGGIFSPATPDGRVIRRKGWWEQCEAIRAMMHFAIRRGRGDLFEPLNETLRFVRQNYVDPEFGGWYKSIEGEDSVRDESKGDEWKVDYHIVGMCMEAINLSESF
ncbi:hypothetical protein DRO35_00610 [Candidatus Bathyarchaeota archaeon]|nr:MAG: hypothetical protein DRO35_00610 [Candidatus Bathyarchaeota archaeon]